MYVMLSLLVEWNEMDEKIVKLCLSENKLNEQCSDP
jgi:hypothetical protein